MPKADARVAMVPVAVLEATTSIAFAGGHRERSRAAQRQLPLAGVVVGAPEKACFGCMRGLPCWASPPLQMMIGRAGHPQICGLALAARIGRQKGAVGRPGHARSVVMDMVGPPCTP